MKTNGIRNDFHTFTYTYKISFIACKGCGSFKNLDFMFKRQLTNNSFHQVKIFIYQHNHHHSLLISWLIKFNFEGDFLSFNFHIGYREKFPERMRQF